MLPNTKLGKKFEDYLEKFPSNGNCQQHLATAEKQPEFANVSE